MPRRMSFALTEAQMLDGSKDVTRRLGWRDLRAGQQLIAVRQCMGLRKGERQVVLGTIRVVSVTFEVLSDITPEEVRREGLPALTPDEFVHVFARANNCSEDAEVTRIEFTHEVDDVARATLVNSSL